MIQRLSPDNSRPTICCRLSYALLVLSTVLAPTALAQERKARVSPVMEIEIVDPRRDARGNPAIDITRDELGNQQVDIAPL